MDSEEKRKTLNKQNSETDKNVLNEVKAIYNVHSKNEETSSKIVGYTIDGKPLTKETYIQKVKEAEQKMNEGQFITSEDLKKKMASW
jgi:uncharacterized protein (UPF0297 family)